MGSGRRQRMLAVAVTLLLVALAPPPGSAASEADLGLALDFLAANLELPPPHRPPITNVVEALAAMGTDAKAWPPTSTSAWDRLAPYGNDSVTDYNSRIRIAHAAAVSGYDPRDVHGVDYVAEVWSGHDHVQFGSPSNLNDDVWAILALVAAGVPRTHEAIGRALLQIEAGRAADGGWAYMRNALTSDTEITSMVLVAKAAAAGGTVHDERAQAILDASFNGAGHTRHFTPGATCQSTAWAIHGYAALGLSPRPEALTYLQSLQDKTTGGFRTSTSAGATTNAFCTAEAVVALSGGRYPLAGFGGGRIVAASAAHALEPVHLRVEGAFTHATWDWGNGAHDGLAVDAHFAMSGAHVVRVHATGDGVHSRLTHVVDVASARPILTLAPPATVALRHTPVTLDARASHDPDGTVTRLEVSWGDGNLTHHDDLVAVHAYERPGILEARVRVQDDAGVWSVALAVAIEVRNRPPALTGLPAHVVADRVMAVELMPVTSDPDGDIVHLAWHLGETSGEGPFLRRFDTLGNHTVRFTATDAHGMAATHNVIVDVRNLPPKLENLTLPEAPVANEKFAFSVEAQDADGPAPFVTWHFSELRVEGASGNISLTAGEHEVRVIATDFDGARRERAASLVVVAEDAHEGAPPVRVAPRLEDVNVRMEEDALAVDFLVEPEGSDVWLTWRSEDDGGEVILTSGMRVALPRGVYVQGTLEARHDELTTRHEWGPLRLPHAPLSAPELHPMNTTVDEATSIPLEEVDDVSQYRFHFGDGHATDWTTTPHAVHAWRAPGTYALMVEARAADGRTSSASTYVHVEAHPVEVASHAVEAPEAPLDTTDNAPPVLKAEEAPRTVPFPGLLAAFALALLVHGRERRGA